MNEGDVCIVQVINWTREEYYRFCQILKKEYGLRVVVSELSFESIQHVDNLNDDYTELERVRR